MSNYTPIHVHTAYSIRDSIAKIPDLVSRSKELGCESLAVTEHGFFGSSYKFYKECKKQNIKPILGMEAYYSDSVIDDKNNYHLCLFAKNNNGYKNLCAISSEAYINNFYKKPRVNFEILKRYKDDIIVSTGCMQGIFQQLVLAGEIDKANQKIDEFYDLFRNDFYLEVHNHNIAEEVIIKDHFRNYGREKGIKIIAGTDVHMVNKSDKDIHTIFKQIAYNSVGKSDDGFDGNGYHLLSYDEMLERFEEEEIHNTNEIADKCNIKFDFTGYYLPKYEVENSDKDVYEHLREVCYTSLDAKGLRGNQLYIDKLEHELNMLHMADLENYLLIVSDYCNWAKNNDIPVGPGRGSMGGSIVSWLTGITEVDPVKYGLLFSRAINVGRSLQYDFGV